METELAQLNEAVPGVIGSMAVDAEGRLVAHSFPAGTDVSRLQAAATLLVDRSAGLESAIGAVRTMDLRFASSRIVVKSASGARLLLLCAPTVNLSLLSMSAAGPLRRLAQAPAPAVRAVPAQPEGGELYRIVQQIDGRLLGKGADRFKLRGQIAMKAGFSLDLVEADTPDDPERIQKLRAAAAAVLGKM